MHLVPSNQLGETWVQVSETIGNLQAEITAGLLRTQNIPVYVDVGSAHTIFPGSAFGPLSGIVRIFVPEEYYEIAISLLNADDEDFDDFFPDDGGLYQ